MKSPGAKFARQIDWNLLKVFHEIATAGGVTRAAQGLSRKQPSVSLSLKRLEAWVGVTLCKRSRQGFELTDEGRLMAETCGHLAELIREIPSRVADAAQEVTGRVRIRLISNLVNSALDDAIARFHRKYPRVEINVDVATWAEVVNALLQDEIDIGLAPTRFRRAELTYQLLFREVHRLYCGRSHPLYRKTIRNPATIASQGFILTGSDEPDELTGFRLRYGLGRVVAGVSEHLEEARRLTVLGVGLCFLPEGFADEDVKSGRLWLILPPENAPSMEVFIITNPNNPRHIAQQLFVDELLAQIEADST